MKLSNVLFTIAVVILLAWAAGLVLKFTAWLINGLVYVAAIIFIIALLKAYFEGKRNKSN